MYCQSCGEYNEDSVVSCKKCSLALRSPQAGGSMMRRDVPICTVCGNIGHFRKGPVLQPHDIIIFLALLILFGAGFIYLIICLLLPKPLICPKCKSKNTFNYVY